MSNQSPIAILMPKWGLAMHEGAIVDWHVAEGEQVSTGMTICDIETNKITNEFESPADGTVLRLVKQTGEMIDVGAVIAVVGETGTDDNVIDALIAEHESAGEEGAGEDGDNGPATVETDAGEIAYRASGDETGAETILLLHGFGGDHGNWGMLQSALPQQFRVIAMDLPGHGGSTRNVGNGTPRDLAKAVLSFARALDLRAVHLVAHSFGANVAAATLAQDSQLAKTLTVIAPPAFGAVPNSDYVEGFVGAQRKKDMRPVMEMLFSDPDMVSRTMVNEAIAAYRDDEARSALETVGAALLKMKPSNPDQDAVFLAEKNANIVWGDADAIVPLPDRARELAGDRFEIIEGAGHMPHVEYPDRVAALIEAIVAGK